MSDIPILSWRCVHCDHDKFVPYETQHPQLVGRMVSCAACASMHSKPEPEERDYLAAWLAREIEDAAGMTEEESALRRVRESVLAGEHMRPAIC